MKKITLFLIFSSNLYFCQEVDKDIYAKAGLPTPIDLPTQTELPSVSASIEKADMMMKGYSDSPPKPDFPKFPEWMHKQPPTLKDNSKEIEKITERIRRNTAELEYINKLRRDSLLREINGGDTFQKIIDEQNSKIDVSGGWAKKSDIENSESDVETQSPIEVSISDEHNNSSNNLTLIFMIFLVIVGIIVFLIFKFLRKGSIDETVKTIVTMYRMSGGSDKRTSLRNVLYFRIDTANKIGNPNVKYVANLMSDEFFDFIKDDIALFIFALLMAESDLHNKEYSKRPTKYFFEIEAEVLKQLHTYNSNRDINYIIVELLAQRYSRFIDLTGRGNYVNR